jgi:hypothetical protein
MSVSFSTLWQESFAFARRESSLLIPLSLSTLAMGQTGAVVAATVLKQVPTGGTATLVFILSYFLILVGQLAITALVLKPGISVAEAINLAVRRVPKMIGLALLIVFLLLLVLLPCVALIAMRGFDVSSPNPQLTMGDLLLLAPFFALALWINVRLFPIQALIVEQNPPLLPACAKAFTRTKGKALPLIAVVAGFLFISQLLQVMAAAIVSALFSAVSGTAGLDFGGTVMVALAAGMVATYPAMIAVIFAALFYKNGSD